jgi:hypothetical protein
VWPSCPQACIRQAGRLLHRQGVHVGAQSDRGLAIAVAQDADHAGLADPAMDLDTPFLQLAGDDVGGAEFLQAQFGMGVDIAANRCEFVLVQAGVIKCGLGHRMGHVTVEQLIVARGSCHARPVRVLLPKSTGATSACISISLHRVRRRWT